MKYRDFIDNCVCTLTLLIIIILLILISSLKCCGQVNLLMPNDGLWYTYTTDNAILYDDGGLGDYANDGLGALTIYPVSGNVIATVGFFDVEFNSTCSWDVFEVYDGDDFTTLIGSYCGTTIPSYFESTHPTGALTFLWSSDGSVTFPGFEIRLGNTGFALPIELLSFTAGYNGDAVIIDWSVASQVNNDYYEVQRSIDIEDWITIATVEGAGNNNTQIDYKTLDPTPLIGISYYRLLQTDYDGTTESFFPVSVVIEKREKTVVKTINLYGQEVDNRYKGMVIDIYRDNTVCKRVQ